MMQRIIPTNEKKATRFQEHSLEYSRYITLERLHQPADVGLHFDPLELIQHIPSWPRAVPIICRSGLGSNRTRVAERSARARTRDIPHQTLKATHVMSVEMLWKLCGNEPLKTNCLPGIAVKTGERK